MHAEHRVAHAPASEPHTRRVHRSPEMLDDYVVAMLGAANRPLGAYEIAQKSRQSGSPLAPNQVYRIVDRLMARGTVQRIELLSAYVLTDGERHGFMVCRSCQAVESFAMDDLRDAITPLCESHGFEPETSIVEISGQCRECTDQAPAAQRRKIGGGMQLLLVFLATAGATDFVTPGDAEAREAVSILVGSEEKRRAQGLSNACGGVDSDQRPGPFDRRH